LDISQIDLSQFGLKAKEELKPDLCLYQDRRELSLPDDILKMTEMPLLAKERNETLSEIQSKADEVTHKTDKLLQPFTILSKRVAEIFQYQGIKLTDNIRVESRLKFFFKRKKTLASKRFFKEKTLASTLVF
jgi:hypothetical protein